MGKFECLTRYLSVIDLDEIGTWVFNNKDDRPGAPVRAPYIKYTGMVLLFIKDVFDFRDRNADLGLDRYDLILQENGIKWGQKTMKEADVSQMDGRGVIALIIGVLRAEHFSDGQILDFFKDGTMKKWLKRLKEIDRT